MQPHSNTRNTHARTPTHAPRAPQVALLVVGCIHQRLRVGEVVDGGDAAALDLEVLMDDLGGQSEGASG